MEIVLTPQPAQSPDLNLNDLGFFSSFDKHLGSYRPFDLLQLWKKIETAFQTYPPEKLDQLVETKKAVIKKIIEVKGDNSYRLPHK